MLEWMMPRIDNVKLSLTNLVEFCEASSTVRERAGSATAAMPFFRLESLIVDSGEVVDWSWGQCEVVWWGGAFHSFAVDFDGRWALLNRVQEILAVKETIAQASNVSTRMNTWRKGAGNVQSETQKCYTPINLVWVNVLANNSARFCWQEKHFIFVVAIVFLIKY